MSRSPSRKPISRLRPLTTPRKAHRRSSCRGVRAGVGPRLGSALIERDLAVVDPLFVLPLLAEAFLPGRGRERARRKGRPPAGGRYMVVCVRGLFLGGHGGR